jgi:predicted glycosyl hydrolase (DUF1957 family)
MSKITWVNFLHIYQPPWQEEGILHQTARESYDYLFTLLSKYPNFTFTLNISGSLIEQLNSLEPAILAKLQQAIKNKRLELTGSACYHPILPLLPEQEVVRQIKLNQDILFKYFKIKPQGFYLPEMAYSLKTAKIIKKLGFTWLILDPISSTQKTKVDILYQLKNLGLKIIFRDREYSQNYPAEIIYQKFQHKKSGECRTETIITATDGEMYGHKHEDWQGHLEKILVNKNLAVLTVSQYLKTLKQQESISLRDSSWETSLKDLKQNIPFALWQNPKNPIHQALWQLANFSISLVKKYPKDQNHFWARHHLDRGLSSCTFWWASAKKTGVFSELAWHPDMVDNGTEELVRSVRSLKQASSKEKIQAERYYAKAKRLIWETHWRKYNI